MTNIQKVMLYNIRGSDFSLTIALSEDGDIFWNIALFEKLMAGNNPDVDLLNDNLYTKFGKFCPFIQDIEQKPNSDINQGP